MKTHSRLLLVITLLIGTGLNAQITFNACNPLLEDQDYTFSLLSTDVTGRSVFETSPITGDQNCGGIGVCEMKIAWSDSNNRWEIFADDGNGTFINTYILYYNTEASTPNPPSLILGSWVENTSVTAGLCVDGITTLTGNVQDTTLSVLEDELFNNLDVYPNPVVDRLFIRSNSTLVESFSISDINGRTILKDELKSQHIDVSHLKSGLYFVTLQTEISQIIKKIIVK